MRLNIRPLWSPPLKFSALQCGEYFIIEGKNEVHQKTRKPGWSAMATRVKTGEVLYVNENRTVIRMIPHQVCQGEDDMSKISFVPDRCPPQPKAVSFSALQVGETFRLLNGQKTMIKINGQWGGAEEAAYLHSGESKVLNGTDLVVRRKVSMTDHGDE